MQTTKRKRGRPKLEASGQFMSVAEAARTLQMSRRHLYRLIGQGKIAAARLMNRTVLSRNVVEGLVQDALTACERLPQIEEL